MSGAIRRLLIISLTLATWLHAQEPPVAFMDVTVVPMDKEQILPHQTLVVVGGRITQLGPAASVKVPRDAVKIDGRGKYLMPGLADMHVHFVRPAASGQFQPSASRDYAQENQDLALILVANGVTTVRNMWGDPAIDAFAKEVDSGRVLGPHIYSVGPLTDGSPPIWEGSRVVETRQQAEEAVRSDRRAGYVAIKVYNRLSENAYQALVIAAREQGLPVVGHVPTAVGLSGAIAAHQYSIEHLTGFWEALQPDDSAAQKKSPRELVHQADLKKLPGLVQATKAADVWNCPTLAVGNHIIRTDAVWFQEQSLVPPAMVERYKKAYTLNTDDPRFSPEARALNNAIVKALHDGGAHLLLGTDAVKPSVLPGFSLHEELEKFVATGMTPYEAIRAGTSAVRSVPQMSHQMLSSVARRNDNRKLLFGLGSGSTSFLS
jgi:imidazolonepropionase-like amidohydrolase